MDHGDTAQVAAVLGALGVPLFLLARARLGNLLGLVLIAAAEGALAYSLVPGSDLERLIEPRARIGLLAVAVIALLGLAALLARIPALVPAGLLLVAPFRVPVELGDQVAFLLVPLYVVLAACVLALVYRTVRGPALPVLPRALAIPSALFLSLSALSLLWSRDLRAGAIELLFFLFPFAALVVVVARSPVRAWLTRTLVSILVGLASIFAVIGISQIWTRDLYFARDLEVANAYTSFFRVTSLFKDPSLYGRHLVLAIAVLLLVLWRGHVRAAVAAPVIGLLWVGLYLSYSQSSMITLIVVTLAVTLVAADRMGRRIVGAAAVVFVLVGAGIVATTVRGESTQRATSGRSSLVSTTARVFQQHPVVGVGVGAQPLASRQEARSRSVRRLDASHTTPLTIAAELGVVGLLVYLAFLAGAVNVLAAARRRNELLGYGLCAVFLGLFVHALFYSGFFEDPLTWGVLAAAAVAPAAPTA